MDEFYIDADAMYESRFERDETWDDFDSEVTCEEFYDEEPELDEFQDYQDWQEC